MKKKFIIAWALMTAGTIGAFLKIVYMPVGMSTTFSWGHLGLLAIPPIAMVIGILDDYNDKVGNKLMWSFLVAIFCIPIAVLTTKIFVVSGNSFAWTIAEWCSCIFTAILLISDSIVEENHRAKYGLPIKV